MNNFFAYIYFDSILSSPLHLIKRLYILVFEKGKMIMDEFLSMLSKIGVSKTAYKKIRCIKGKYAGKRCFVACTGPSLTIDDLEKLRNEYVFGMNSICLIHEKTTWQPDFFGIQDKFVFEKIKETLLSTNNGTVFAPYSFKEKYGTPDDWFYLPIRSAYHMYELIYETKYFSKFSGDCSSIIYDGYSITHTILQLAVYMGFDEIYLIGADCTYLGAKQHFIEHGNIDPTINKATDRLLASYSAANDYAKCHNVKIYNATRGGCLEIFPRVALDDVLGTNEKNKCIQKS